MVFGLNIDSKSQVNRKCCHVNFCFHGSSAEPMQFYILCFHGQWNSIYYIMTTTPDKFYLTSNKFY